MRKILCHVGPWSLEHYKHIANSLMPDASVSVVSGHPKCDNVEYYCEYHNLVTEPEFSTTEIIDCENEIILRCRLLRALPKPIALRHLRASWVAMGGVLDKIQPDLILTETIDSYVMDVLYYQAMDRGIPFLGLVPTFISGYFRVSARGEYVKSREVSDTEADEVLNRLLQNKYKPDFIKSNNNQLMLYAAGRWLRNLVKLPFFAVKRLNQIERFNYHNWATLYVSIEWMHLIPSLFIGNAGWRDRVLKSEKPVIYVPLQMFPEATIDYWCDDLEAVNYHTYLVKLLAHLGHHFTLIVKEHPNVLGYRNPRLYSQLAALPGVIIAPTTTNSHDLIEAANAVLVWTGSVGFEAAIRGKPVLTTCRPYYQNGPLFKHIDLSTTEDEIKGFIQTAAAVDIVEMRKLMIKHVLSGALPGRYIIDGTWRSDNSDHVLYADNIAHQLHRHLAYNGVLNDEPTC